MDAHTWAGHCPEAPPEATGHGQCPGLRRLFPGRGQQPPVLSQDGRSWAENGRGSGPDSWPPRRRGHQSKGHQTQPGCLGRSSVPHTWLQPHADGFRVTRHWSFSLATHQCCWPPLAALGVRCLIIAGLTDGALSACQALLSASQVFLCSILTTTLQGRGRDEESRQR